ISTRTSRGRISKIRPLTMLPSLKSRRDFAISSCISVISFTNINKPRLPQVKSDRPGATCRLRTSGRWNLAGKSAFARIESTFEVEDASRTTLFHQEDGARSFDLAGNFAMKVSRHPSHPPWKNLAALRNKFFQKVRILIIDCFGRDINPATWHDSICAAKIGPAYGVFRFHGDYFTSRCKVWRRRKGLYFFFSKRPGVFGLFLFRVLT